MSTICTLPTPYVHVRAPLPAPMTSPSRAPVLVLISSTCILTCVHPHLSLQPNFVWRKFHIHSAHHFYSSTSLSPQYEIRCKDLYRLVFGDAGSRDPQGCSHIQFASRGKVLQYVLLLKDRNSSSSSLIVISRAHRAPPRCLQCQYEMDKFWLRVGSYIETKDIPPDN